MGSDPVTIAGMRALAIAAFAVLLAAAPDAQDRPPRDAKATRQADLVELVTLDPTIKLDIRYAATNNFLGKVGLPGGARLPAAPGRRVGRWRRTRSWPATAMAC